MDTNRPTVGREGALADDDLLTRDKILSTSFALFLKRGYEHTPVQAIIDAVGIAKGTFYHHFKSKEEMLVALVEGLSLAVVNAVEPIVNDTRLSALEKFLAASQAGVARKVEDFGPETLVLVKQMQDPSNRQLAASIERILTEWVRPLYLRVVRQGIAEGTFAVSDPESSTDFLLSVILSTQTRVLRLFVEAVEGDSTAIDRLEELHRAVEQAVERLLGAPDGSLPLYRCVDIRGVLTRFAATLSSPGGTP